MCERSQDEIKNVPIKVESRECCLSRISPTSKKYIGIGLAIFTTVISAINDLLLNITDGVSPTMISGIAALGPSVTALPLLIYRREPILFSKKKMSVIVSRSLFGTFGDVARFISFTCLPLGEASVLCYSLLVYSLIFGYFIYQEPCGLWEVGLIVLDFTGVFLVASPSLSTAFLTLAITSGRKELLELFLPSLAVYLMQ
ncbi:solute carrier family 35 member G1-like [Tachypleus tridentatus]|uniref:solute carrier family 35 member G1-like n=1 Tax=Tachypleus tridentatus TaxID=6853 RepID=UPI003FD5F50B